MMISIDKLNNLSINCSPLYNRRPYPSSAPSLFAPNFSFLQSFRALKFSARMLIGNFDKSLMCSETVASLFKNGHIGPFFACTTKPIVVNVGPLFLILRHSGTKQVLTKRIFDRRNCRWWL